MGCLLYRVDIYIPKLQSKIKREFSDLLAPAEIS